VVAAGVVRYQQFRLQATVSVLKQQNGQLQKSLKQLIGKVVARQPDSEIEASFDRVTVTMVRRRQLLGRLENVIPTEVTGFSVPLLALARQVPQGLWLTQIRLDALQGDVGLAGKAQSGQLVPMYLGKLGDEPAFAGKTFASFRLSREEDGRWIEFQVATDTAVEGAQ